MKNSQKGSVTTILAIIIVVLILVIAGGVYMYENQKIGVTEVINNDAQPSGQGQQPAVQTQSAAPSSVNNSGQIAVAGMSQYTDQEFGFSFWYPNWLQVTEAPVMNQNKYPGGTVLKQLNVTDGHENITIEEFVSPTDSITDSTGVGACPVCNTTNYYFNPSLHTWMVMYPNGTDSGITPAGVSVAANVSNNTMGGLHMLAGSMRFGANTIIPLSAKDFLIVSVDATIATGSGDSQALAKTIVATDPSVATPVSQLKQTQTIQAELAAYSGLESGTWAQPGGGAPSAMVTHSYSDPTFPYTLSYPSDFALASSLNSQQQTSAGSYMGACPLSSFAYPAGEIGFCYIGNLKDDGFEAAAIDVTASTTMSIQNCAQPEPKESSSPIPTPVTINGIIFNEVELGDAGLGHYLSTDSYRTYHTGACYTVDLKIASGRGASEKGISPDFSAMMQSKLKSILATFQFTR